MNKYENHLTGKDILLLAIMASYFIVAFILLAIDDFRIQKELDNALTKIDQQDTQIEEYINDNNEKDVYIEWLQDQIRIRDKYEEVE